MSEQPTDQEAETGVEFANKIMYAIMGVIKDETDGSGSINADQMASVTMGVSLTLFNFCINEEGKANADEVDFFANVIAETLNALNNDEGDMIQVNSARVH